MKLLLVDSRMSVEDNKIYCNYYKMIYDKMHYEFHKLVKRQLLAISRC